MASNISDKKLSAVGKFGPKTGINLQLLLSDYMYVVTFCGWSCHNADSKGYYPEIFAIREGVREVVAYAFSQIQYANCMRKRLKSKFMECLIAPLRFIDNNRITSRSLRATTLDPKTKWNLTGLFALLVPHDRFLVATSHMRLRLVLPMTTFYTYTP